MAQDHKGAWIGASAAIIAAIITALATWSVATGTGRVSELENEIQSLEGQVSSAHTTIERQKNDLSVAQNTIAELRIKVQEQKQKLTEADQKISSQAKIITQNNDKLQICVTKNTKCESDIATCGADLTAQRRKLAVHQEALQQLEQTKLIQVYDSSRRRSGFQETQGKIEDTFHCVIDRFAQTWNEQVELLAEAGTAIKRLKFEKVNHDDKCP